MAIQQKGMLRVDSGTDSYYNVGYVAVYAGQSIQERQRESSTRLLYVHFDNVYIPGLVYYFVDFPFQKIHSQHLVFVAAAHTGTETSQFYQMLHGPLGYETVGIFGFIGHF